MSRPNRSLRHRSQVRAGVLCFALFSLVVWGSLRDVPTEEKFLRIFSGGDVFSLDVFGIGREPATRPVRKAQKTPQSPGFLRKRTRPPSRRLQRLRYQTFPIRGKARSLASVEALIRPFRVRLRGQMSRVLAYAPKLLKRKRPESPLGNLVAETCLGRLRALGFSADLFVTNIGGIRKDLAAGPISVGDVFEVLPFENQLVVLELSGTVMAAVFDQIAKMRGVPIAGARMQIESGRRRARGVMVRGRPLDKGRRYFLGTSDYLAQTGWLARYVEQGVLHETGFMMREAMIWGLASRGMRWAYRVDGRVQLSEAVKPQQKSGPSR